jgi:hypothetical protein
MDEVCRAFAAQQWLGGLVLGIGATLVTQAIAAYWKPRNGKSPHHDGGGNGGEGAWPSCFR